MKRLPIGIENFPDMIKKDYLENYLARNKQTACFGSLEPARAVFISY